MSGWAGGALGQARARSRVRDQGYSADLGTVPVVYILRQRIVRFAHQSRYRIIPVSYQLRYRNDTSADLLHGTPLAPTRERAGFYSSSHGFAPRLKSVVTTVDFC